MNAEGIIYTAVLVEPLPNGGFRRYNSVGDMEYMDAQGYGPYVDYALDRLEPRVTSIGRVGVYDDLSDLRLELHAHFLLPVV